MEKNLGHATAYGYAKSKGYSGTEDEFAQLMGDYASVGQSAAQSAEQAAASAESASGSAATASQAAQTATSKASDAIIAEGVATAKAEDAQVYATSANQSAEFAGTSAQTATTAATTATDKASEASESATTATAAKTDAESARDAAAQSASRAERSAESIDPDEFDRKIYAAFVTDTASGAIASFAGGADNIPMKDVLVHIEPVQAGSGDPSPDNVRPITGWTGAKVTRTGKNLLNDTIRYQPTNYQTIIFGQTTAYAAEQKTFLKAGTYTFSVKCDSTQRTSGYYKKSGDTENTRLWTTVYGDASGVFTLDEDSWCAFWIYSTDALNSENIYAQVELGSTATDYKPYSGQTYDITFSSEAGTVCSGTLDVTSGELVVDRAQIASYNGEALPSTWISDRDVYASGTTPTIGAQVVYKLASPITYTLTPQEITSLLGVNNMWADTGDSEVEYRADTKMYITKKITEAVSALS